MTIRKQEDWLLLGKVGKPYGLRGQFYISQLDHEPPLDLTEVVVGETLSSGKLAQVAELRTYKDRPLLSLDMIEDRTALESFRGQNLWLAKDETQDPFDLYIDRQVVDCHHNSLGKTSEIVDYGAGPNIVIEATDLKTLELPFIEDYFFIEDSDKGPLKLKQPIDFFEDLWHQPSP